MKILLSLLFSALLLQSCGAAVTSVRSPSVGQAGSWGLRDGRLESVIGVQGEDKVQLDSTHVLKVVDSWGDQYFFRATTMENPYSFGQHNPTTSTWTGYDLRSGSHRSMVIDEYCQLTLHKL